LNVKRRNGNRRSMIKAVGPKKYKQMKRLGDKIYGKNGRQEGSSQKERYWGGKNSADWVEDTFLWTAKTQKGGGSGYKSGTLHPPK